MAENVTFSKLGCCCWYTSAVYALRKAIREDIRPLLWQTTFSSVDPRILKIIFCRPFTPDNQVIVFSVSDYMFIREAIFTVTENGTFYYIIMGQKVHCKSLFYRYKTSVHTIYCLIFNKSFLSINPVKVKVKVKQSHYRPGQALRVPGGWGSPYFQTVGTWRWQGCQPYAPAAFIPQEIFLVFICVSGRIDPRAIVRPEGLCQWKIPMTPSGIY